MASRDDRSYLDEVVSYWEETTGLYLNHGTTFQGGLIGPPGQSVDATRSNLLLASRAGIGPAARVLDAGCGVCGPSIDIAKETPGVQIDAVTVSPTQAACAREAVRMAGLDHRVRVHVEDYHRLPFEDGRFDVVIFFESLYTRNLPALLAEVHRVLAAGGILYAKEVFRPERQLSGDEEAALAEFEELFCYEVRRTSDMVSAMTAAGFANVTSCDLSELASTAHYDAAMVETVFGFTIPSLFGRRHQRRHSSVPLLFGEVKGFKQ